MPSKLKVKIEISMFFLKKIASTVKFSLQNRKSVTTTIKIIFLKSFSNSFFKLISNLPFVLLQKKVCSIL